MKNKWVILGLILAGGLFWWSRGSVSAVSKDVKSVNVERKDLKDELTFSGTVDATEKATLRFQSSGKLVYVGVKEGDKIAKYKLLGQLDTAELKKRFDRYMNTHRKNYNSFEQGEQDNKDFETNAEIGEVQKKTIRRTLMDNALDLGNAVIDVELQEMAIKDSYLYSPIPGIVTRVGNPIAGAYITPTQGEFEVVNPASIYFSATADQSEVAKLTPGMAAEVTLDAFSDSKLTGSIERIGFTPKAGETGTVYEVKIKVPIGPLTERLRLGMTGDVSFLLETKRDVLVVPARYIKNDKGRKYVSVMEGGKLIKKYVEIDGTWSGETVIKSGVDEGVKVYDQSL